VATKRCSKCGETKPLGDFNRNRATRDGLAKWCSACCRIAARAWRDRNADRARENARLYGAAHPEARARRAKRWREENPDRFKERRDAWRQENPDQARVLRTLDNHRRRGARAERDAVEILRADPCVYCGNAGGTIEHIIPVIAGGSGEWENLAGACRSCNSGKGDTPLLLFLLSRVA
jgi:5-methylcytosine-specific restriction endonuclease McrA